MTRQIDGTVYQTVTTVKALDDDWPSENLNEFLIWVQEMLGHIPLRCR